MFALTEEGQWLSSEGWFLVWAADTALGIVGNAVDEALYGLSAG